jgi:hypothetical protein
MLIEPKKFMSLLYLALPFRVPRVQAKGFPNALCYRHQAHIVCLTK